MAVDYSEIQLRQLIAKAKQLGFWDDVAHFTGLLTEMVGEDNV